MPLDEPSWWYRDQNALTGQLLQPIASVYGAIAARRLKRAPAVVIPLPVICIGNFTAGGTGKTPLAIWLANYLRDLQLKPVFLSRGYGGSLNGPHLVQPGIDGADEVGDEPLLLSSYAPVVIAKDRGQGGAYIAAGDLGNVIIMDDGLQNPTLRKDLIISVVSAERGVGNGKVVPAGPLRAPLADQLDVTDIVLINLGAGPVVQSDQIEQKYPMWLPPTFDGLVVEASTQVRGDVRWVTAQPILAFAGIGHPDRFFNLLRQLGGDVREARAFRDHQPLSDGVASELIAHAAAQGCQLVTTEKDLARLDPGSEVHGELRARSRSLDIELEIVDGSAETLRGKVRETVARFPMLKT